MDKAQFWRLVEDAKTESDGECEEQAELLQQSLEMLPQENIIVFDKLYFDLSDDAYRWDLWGGAVMINRSASDDGFEYFCG